MRSLLASPLGFLIGLSLGALGGGGSILAVPALVYGAGQSARAATGTSLLIVGLSALLGAISHRRSGNVRVASGVVFALAGIGGNAAGTALNRSVDPDLLLLLFSGLMVVAATAMFRRARQRSRPATGRIDTESAAGPGAIRRIDAESADPASRRIDVDSLPGAQPTGPLPGAIPDGTAGEEEASKIAGSRMAIRVLIAGTVVGAITGFFGVGGGFVIVPALVLSLGFAMPEAVGTSLLIIALNAAVSLALRAGNTEIDLAAAAPFLFAAGLGTLIGGRISYRIDAARLTRAFVVLLVAVACYTATRSIIALA